MSRFFSCANPTPLSSPFSLSSSRLLFLVPERERAGKRRCTARSQSDASAAVPIWLEVLSVLDWADWSRMAVAGRHPADSRLPLTPLFSIIVRAAEGAQVQSVSGLNAEEHERCCIDAFSSILASLTRLTRLLPTNPHIRTNNQRSSHQPHDGLVHWTGSRLSQQQQR